MRRVFLITVRKLVDAFSDWRMFLFMFFCYFNSLISVTYLYTWGILLFYISSYFCVISFVCLLCLSLLGRKNPISCTGDRHFLASYLRAVTPLPRCLSCASLSVQLDYEVLRSRYIFFKNEPLVSMFRTMRP